MAGMDGASFDASDIPNAELEAEAWKIAQLATALAAQSWSIAPSPIRWEDAITDARGCLAEARRQVFDTTSRRVS